MLEALTDLVSALPFFIPVKKIPEPYSPKEVDDHVETLLDRLDAQFDPEQVPVKIEPYSKAGNCYINVEEKVKRDGGAVHYGWRVIISDVLCEAERHAVWESEEGNLVDITPPPLSWDTIMFVSDNDFVYEGQLVDNIRVNITPFSATDDFIVLCEVVEELYSYGNRTTDERMNVPFAALQLIQQYEPLKVGYLEFIRNKGRGERSCFCKSGKQYRKCHGKPFINQLLKDKERVKRELGR